MQKTALICRFVCRSQVQDEISVNANGLLFLTYTVVLEQLLLQYGRCLQLYKYYMTVC